MLATPAIDVWVTTASGAGAPHLVPVSLAWVAERVVVAADGPLGEAYVAQADWGSAHERGLRVPRAPPRARAGVREANEMSGRTLMRDGRWRV
jgi:hypothetical protein